MAGSWTYISLLSVPSFLFPPSCSILPVPSSLFPPSCSILPVPSFLFPRSLLLTSAVSLHPLWNTSLFAFALALALTHPNSIRSMQTVVATSYYPMSQQFQTLNPSVETASADLTEDANLHNFAASSDLSEHTEDPDNLLSSDTSDDQEAAEKALAAELEREEAQTDLILRPEPFRFDLVALLRRSAINLVLPFINGMMLGFGEILAHEIGFRYNWIGAKVQPPRRTAQRTQNADSKFL